MSDEGQPLKAEHVFKKFIWRNSLKMSEPMEQATTWSITGVAAIAALLISNLDSIAQLVTRGGLRWSLLFFVASLITGAVSKQIGMAISKGLEMIQNLENHLGSEQGILLLGQIRTPIQQLISEIASPFFWPLSHFMRKSGATGLKDYLATDKRFIMLFCLQLIFVYLHGIFAAVGLIIIAVSIIS